MEAKRIQALNEAVHVIRNFVELSSELLFVYNKITQNKGVTSSYQFEKKKIETIYSKQNLNPKVGRFLLGSNIIELINDAYRSMYTRKKGQNAEIDKKLKIFADEYNHLKRMWSKQALN